MEIVELGPSDERLDEVFPVLYELRDHLTRDGFRMLYAEGYPDGYRIAALIDEDECRAVTGYRVMTNLVHGRVLYVDDLVTKARYRSRGYGKALVDHVVRVAEQAGCETVTLDSHTNRTASHRFYFREGFVVTSFHFGRRLST